MKINIIFKVKFTKPTPKQIQATLVTIVRKLKVKKKFKELTVVFITPQECKKLNKHYRGKPKPTDILSFAPIESTSLGELALCPVVIRQQAKENELPFGEQLLYILIHGVLHLLGYDHEGSVKEAKRMYAIQDRIFEEMR